MYDWLELFKSNAIKELIFELSKKVEIEKNIFELKDYLKLIDEQLEILNNHNINLCKEELKMLKIIVVNRMNILKENKKVYNTVSEPSYQTIREIKSKLSEISKSAVNINKMIFKSEQIKFSSIDNEILLAEQIKFRSIEDEILLVEKKADIKMKRNEQFANIISNFIKRESISSLFGGVLFFIYGLGLLIAMYKDIKTTEIVQSSFLIILGYFFGHSTKVNL